MQWRGCLLGISVHPADIVTCFFVPHEEQDRHGKIFLQVTT